jgi:uncharacterized damage-inducible protein DinB
MTKTIHPLVTQLQFARYSLERCLEGVSEEDASRRVEPMNCLSWIVGHLANQEQRYWVMVAQGEMVIKDLNDRVGYGKPASTPSLAEMREAWRQITQASDRFLETLDSQALQTHFVWKDKPLDETIGTMLYRNIYHYWFHTGEAYAIREMLGHKNLPEFVGDMDTAVYTPDMGG